MAQLDNPNVLPAGSALLEYQIKSALSADGFGVMLWPVRGYDIKAQPLTGHSDSRKRGDH